MQISTRLLSLAALAVLFIAGSATAQTRVAPSNQPAQELDRSDEGSGAGGDMQESLAPSPRSIRSTNEERQGGGASVGQGHEGGDEDGNGGSGGTGGGTGGN